MLRSLLLDLSGREFPKKVLSSAGSRLASRFIAGEKVDDALRVCRKLNADGFAVTMDCLGESVQEGAQAGAACEVYLHLLDRLAGEKLASHVSVKLTQLGLAMDEEMAVRNLRRIAESAAQHGNFVRVDMEGSAYTEATLRVFAAVGAPREVVGIALQAYLRRSASDVEELLKRGARIRLVKGAYQEPAEIAFPQKQDVDRNYLELSRRLLSSGIYHAIATHDERIIDAVREFVQQQGIAPETFEFQMLFGIRRRLQRELLREGWRVRIYVPFGPEWYAYFMRRLAERPANLFFVLRNLFRA